jgi:hypothetical protein
VSYGDPVTPYLSVFDGSTTARGGSEVTEMGACTTLLNPIKLDSLRAKVDEFLPFGLIPMFITET